MRSILEPVFTTLRKLEFVVELLDKSLLLHENWLNFAFLRQKLV
ncbi:hypothetical protein [Moraxella boevrei]